MNELQLQISDLELALQDTTLSAAEKKAMQKDLDEAKAKLAEMQAAQTSNTNTVTESESFTRVVKLRATYKAPFKADKHGLFPFLLSEYSGKAELPQGSGIVAGSIAKDLGFKDGDTVVLRITQTGVYTNPSTGISYPNYRYELIENVTASMAASYAAAIADKLVAKMDLGF